MQCRTMRPMSQTRESKIYISRRFFSLFFREIFATFLSLQNLSLHSTTYVQEIAISIIIFYFIFVFSDCGFDVQKKYVQNVEELCVGPNTFTSSPSNVSKGDKKSDKKGFAFGITRILSERELPASRKSSVPPASTNNGPQGQFQKVVIVSFSFGIMHSSEIRGLCLMKQPSTMYFFLIELERQCQ